MTQECYSTGRKKFQHLTSEKRSQLEILLNVEPEIPKIKIAQMLGIARSTLYKIENRTSFAVNQAMKKIMTEYGELAPKIFKTITADNGSEFTHLAEAVPNTKVYFAHPYTPSERGTNENQNGIVRRFFPKGKSFENVSDEAVRRVQDWINLLPRRIFDYSCSYDLFMENVNCL